MRRNYVKQRNNLIKHYTESNKYFEKRNKLIGANVFKTIEMIGTYLYTGNHKMGYFITIIL